MGAAFPAPSPQVTPNRPLATERQRRKITACSHATCPPDDGPKKSVGLRAGTSPGESIQEGDLQTRPIGHLIGADSRVACDVRMLVYSSSISTVVSSPEAVESDPFLSNTWTDSTVPTRTAPNKINSFTQMPVRHSRGALADRRAWSLADKPGKKMISSVRSPTPASHVTGSATLTLAGLTSHARPLICAASTRAVLPMPDQRPR